MNPQPVVRPRVAALLVLVAAALGLALLRDEPALAFLSGRLITVVAASLVALVVVCACVALGYAVFPLRCWMNLSARETTLFCFGCGAALLSCLTLSLGMLGWLHPLLLWTVLLLCLAIGGIRAASRPSFYDEVRVRLSRGWSVGAAEAFLLIPLALVAALYLTSSLAPPLLYDITEYHLGAYQSYRAEQAFIPMPFNFYARFPFPVESLYYLSLFIDPPRDFAPKLLNLAFLAADALLIWMWIARCGASVRWRMLGVLLFLAHPVSLEVSLDAYIDPAVAFFVGVTVYALLLATGTYAGVGGHLSLLAPAGLLFGCAMVTKYTAAQLYLFPILVFFAAPALLKAFRSRSITAAAAFCILALVPPLFWLGKNVAFSGNPLEPFFQHVFRPGDTAAIAREKFYIESHFPLSPLSGEYWARLATRMGSVGWLLLAPLIGFAAALPEQRRGVWRLLLLVLFAYLSWNLIRESQARFLLPLILVTVVLSCSGLSALPAGPARAFVACALAVLSCSLLVQHAVRLAGGGEFLYLADVRLASPPREAGPKSDPRSAFYHENLGALAEVMDEANYNIRAGAKVLLVYEARPYLFKPDTVYNTVFDESELLRLAKGARSAQEVTEKLRAAGISHVVVNREELRRFIEQYARPAQLKRIGARDANEAMVKYATPEDLYPPFNNSPEWQSMRQPVLDFLNACRRDALLAAGRAPLEIYISPLPRF